MMKPTDFTRLMTTYLTSYLPLQRNVSSNTIASYSDTFRLLLIFLRDELCFHIDRIRIQDFSPAIIKDFLSWLDSERQCSIATRNQRLAAIRAFFKYVQVEIPGHMLLCQQIIAIPFSKTERPTVNYLTVEETTLILSQPDQSTAAGRRDLCFLCLLYDTGARVSEIINLHVRNVYLDNPAKVILYGKGRKLREVPILPNTVKHLNQYIVEQRLNTPDKLDRPLFVNRQGHSITRSGASYILKKYVQQAGIQSPVTPHVLRHTKAMHMLEAGINLFYIKDFLGHEDVATTEVYAKASIETQRNALEKHSIILPPATPAWVTDTDTLAWLKSLGK